MKVSILALASALTLAHAETPKEATGELSSLLFLDLKLMFSNSRWTQGNGDVEDQISEEGKEENDNNGDSYDADEYDNIFGDYNEDTKKQQQQQQQQGPQIQFESLIPSNDHTTNSSKPLTITRRRPHQYGRKSHQHT
ncbi:hypothetical protein BX616_003089 [Lobosporangium transversale]|nr:hypothetical protein BX616_003089 [Lobosporangium transversale]